MSNDPLLNVLYVWGFAVAFVGLCWTLGELWRLAGLGLEMWRRGTRR